MSQIISIPFQERVRQPLHAGTNYVNSPPVSELRAHPFLAGPENYVLCSAVYDIIQDYPNPFLMVFCAPAGFGKTHLAEGLLLAWQFRRTEGTGKCVSAHTFAREWAAAQRTRTSSEFYLTYHSLDFFALEDLHEIASHPSAQEQLVQVLDVLTRRGARILLTCRQAVSTLPLSAKLASRLRQGVSIEIQLPLPETRTAILAQADFLQKVSITETALNEFVELADQEKLSVGAMLQRCQKMVLSRKSKSETEIHSAAVSEVFTPSGTDTSVTIAQIAKLAAKFYRIRLADLRSKSRKTIYVTVRDIVYLMARRLTNATLDEIGLYFNGRDHTTILHGCAQAELLIQNDEEVKRCVDFLYSELQIINAGSTPQVKEMPFEKKPAKRGRKKKTEEESL